MSFLIVSGYGAFSLFKKRTTIRQFTLHKTERVKKRKTIQRLFSEGRSFSIAPLRVYYLLAPNPPVMPELPLQFGVGVSKRHFKKAVDRNRVKRLIREAYRTQKLLLKGTLAQKEGCTMQVFFIYTGMEMPVFSFVKEKVAAALVRLQKEIEKKP